MPTYLSCVSLLWIVARVSNAAANAKAMAWAGGIIPCIVTKLVPVRRLLEVDAGIDRGSSGPVFDNANTSEQTRE